VRTVFSPDEISFVTQSLIVHQKSKVWFVDERKYLAEDFDAARVETTLLLLLKLARTVGDRQ